MSARISLSQYMLLALGFVAGALVFSGALGPFLTWQGQPTSHRVLLFFALPATATAITFIVASLRRPLLDPQADPTADAAIDSTWWGSPSPPLAT